MLIFLMEARIYLKSNETHSHFDSSLPRKTCLGFVQKLFFWALKHQYDCWMGCGGYMGIEVALWAQQRMVFGCSIKKKIFFLAYPVISNRSIATQLLTRLTQLSDVQKNLNLYIYLNQTISFKHQKKSLINLTSN